MKFFRSLWVIAREFVVTVWDCAVSCWRSIQLEFEYARAVSVVGWVATAAVSVVICAYTPFVAVALSLSLIRPKDNTHRIIRYACIIALGITLVSLAVIGTELLFPFVWLTTTGLVGYLSKRFEARNV